MKNWAWLLPCWVWKYFFAQLRRERVLLDGRTRFLVRLDEEFALVYDPLAKEMLPQSLTSESKHHPSKALPSFLAFEKPSIEFRPMWRKQVSANPRLTSDLGRWHAR